MKKIITLFLIGIVGIILFIVVKNMANGDGLLTISCKSAQNTLTIKIDPTVENLVSATTDDGEDFDLGDLDEKIQKDGELYKAPKLYVNPEVNDFFKFDNSKDLKDIQLIDYKHQGRITMPVTE